MTGLGYRVGVKVVKSVPRVLEYARPRSPRVRATGVIGYARPLSPRVRAIPES